MSIILQVMLVPAEFQVTYYNSKNGISVQKTVVSPNLGYSLTKHASSMPSQESRKAWELQIPKMPMHLKSVELVASW
jgi:hypothetical protein